MSFGSAVSGIIHWLLLVVKILLPSIPTLWLMLRWSHSHDHMSCFSITKWTSALVGPEAPSVPDPCPPGCSPLLSWDTVHFPRAQKLRGDPEPSSSAFTTTRPDCRVPSLCWLLPSPLTLPTELVQFFIEFSLECSLLYLCEHWSLWSWFVTVSTFPVQFSAYTIANSCLIYYLIRCSEHLNSTNISFIRFSRWLKRSLLLSVLFPPPENTSFLVLPILVAAWSDWMDFSPDLLTSVPWTQVCCSPSCSFSLLDPMAAAFLFTLCSGAHPLVVSQTACFGVKCIYFKGCIYLNFTCVRMALG